MISVVKIGCIVSEELLGLTEYYGAVLSRKGLAERECDFRSNKLSFILDFIRAIGIPECLKTQLTAALIDSWRLQVPESDNCQRERELKEVLGCINSIRTVACWAERSTSSLNLHQLNFKILADLPISHLDLRPGDSLKIFDLLNQIFDYYLSLDETGISCKSDLKEPLATD